MKVYRALRAVFAGIGALASVGVVLYVMWELSFPPKFREEARLSSPNSEYDAVVVETNPMAFGTPRFELFIVPYGEQLNAKSTNFKFSNYAAPAIEPEHIRWINDRSLVIQRHPRTWVRHFNADYYDARYPTELATHTEYRTVTIDLVTSQ